MRPSLRATLYLLLLCGLTLPVAGQTLLKPVDGEGIWGMLRRNGIKPTSESVAAFKQINSNRMARSGGLRSDIGYRIPDAESLDRIGNSQPAMALQADESGARVIREPLFGARFQDVAIKTTELEGHVYYVVSGHGGPDPGTQGTYEGRTIAEDEIAYDTALRLARELMERGATVYIIVQDPNDGIRDTEVLGPDTDEVYLGGGRLVRNHRQRLKDRTDLINRLYDKHRSTARSQRLISLHVDAFTSGWQPQIDVHFAYATGSGRKLSQVLHGAINDKYLEHQPGRGYAGRIQERNLRILEDTKPVAVLVELGNIRYRGDQVRLMKPSNRQALAEWITQGLLRDAGISKS